MRRVEAETRVVGRDSELATIRLLLESVSERGSGGTVAVVGPVGIGTSAVLDDTAATANRIGFVVRRVQADRLTQGQPLAIMADLLGTPIPVSAVRLDDQGPQRGFDVTPLGQPETSEVLQAFERMVAGPTLVVIDDLHWADRWSLLLLQRIVPMTQDRPLVLLFGTRSNAVAVRREVAELVSASPSSGTLRIELQPLGMPALLDLARRDLGAEPGPVLREMLARSGGSPLLASELLHALAPGMELDEDGRVDVRPGPVPSEMAGIVELRLGALSGGQRSILQRAAVLGMQFSGADLAAVTVASVLDLAPDLAALCRDGLLDERGHRFAFAHDLVREVIYAENSPSIRQAMHREVAAVLEASGAPESHVVYHLAAGAVPGDEAVVERLLAAAHELEATDPALALSFLERAAEVAGPGDAQQRLEHARAAPLAWAGRLEEASDLLRRAIDADRDPDARAHLRWTLAGLLILANRASEAVTEANRAAAETSDPVTRARVVAEESLARLAIADPDAEATAERALALGEQCGDATAMVTALSALARRRSAQHDYRGGLEFTARAVSLAEGDPTRQAHRMTPWFYHGVMLLDVEDGAGVAEAIRRGRQRVQDLGNHWADPFYCGLAASLAFREGRFDEATAEALGGIALGTDTGTVAPVGWCHAIEAHISLFRGDIDRAAHHVELATELLGSGQVLFGIDFVFRADGLVREASGDPVGALEVLRDAWEGFGAFGVSNCQPLLGPDLVRLARSHGDDGVVADVLAQLDRNNVEGAPSSFAAIDLRARGLATGDPDLLALAVEAYPVGRVLDRALAGLERVECLVDQNRRSEAGRAAPQLAEMFTAMEGDALIGRVAPYVGERESMPTSSGSNDGWDRLTPAETEVVTLLAGGATNAEIARARGTSTRTVETQIHRTYQKLGVSSRTRLAVEAAERFGDGPPGRA